MKKIIMFIMSIFMVFTMMTPISAQTTPIVVHNEQELVEAVKNGGDIHVDMAEKGVYNFYDTIRIEKDANITFINVANGNHLAIHNLNDYGFIVSEGVNLTLSSEGITNLLRYQGDNHLFKLENNSTLTINNVNIQLESFGGKVYKGTLFENNGGNIVLNGGIYYAQGRDFNDYRPIITNNGGTFTVKAGMFRTDMSEYLDPSAVIFEEAYNYYIYLQKGEVADFSDILNSNGKLELKLAKKNNVTQNYRILVSQILSELIDFSKYRVSLKYISDERILVSDVNNQNCEEILIDFIYDPAINERVELIAKNFENYEMFGKPYQIEDLEIANYWAAGLIDGARKAPSEFSEKFKQDLCYYNFKSYFMAGAHELPFYANTYGDAFLKVDDIMYDTIRMNAIIRSIIYIANDNDESIDGIINTIQRRMDERFGKDRFKITYGGTGIKEKIHKDFMGPSEEIELAYNEGCLSYLKDALNDMWFIAEVDGIKNEFVVIKDSSKVQNHTNFTKDIKTDIGINTDSIQVSLDSKIEVTEITSGDKYDKLIKILDVKENQTYDISLKSDAFNKYYKKLDNGKFEVSIPVNAELEGKELVVYYVDENNNITKHPVVVTNGVATFETDHFSIYTLAENKLGSHTITIPTIDSDINTKEPMINVEKVEEAKTIILNSLNQEIKDKINEIIEKGKNVNTVMKIDKIDLSKPTNELDKLIKFTNDKDYKLASAFDINVQVKSENNTLEHNITKTSKPLTFVLTIPEELKMNKKEYVREFYIISEDNGEIEVINPIKTKNGTILFETDKLSTYVIAYKDVKKIIIPDTGIKKDNNIEVVGAIMIISLFSGIIILNKKTYNKR